jgi:hypothetical protein
MRRHRFHARIIVYAVVLTLAPAFLLAASAEAGKAHPKDRNLRPVIGVFSQQTSTVTSSSTIDPEVKAELDSYRYLIPASYVMWIGQAGGRVLPILLDQPDAYYESVFEQTN